MVTYNGLIPKNFIYDGNRVTEESERGDNGLP